MDIRPNIGNMQTLWVSVSTSYHHTLASLAAFTTALLPPSMAITLSAIVALLVSYKHWKYAAVLVLSVLIFHKYQQVKTASDEVNVLQDKLLRASHVARNAMDELELERLKSSQLAGENAQQASTHSQAQRQLEQSNSQLSQELGMKDKVIEELTVDNNKLATKVIDVQSAMAQQQINLELVTAQREKASAESLNYSAQLLSATQHLTLANNKVHRLEPELEDLRRQLRNKDDELLARTVDFSSRSDALARKHDQTFAELSSTLDNIAFLRQKLATTEKAHAAKITQLQHSHHTELAGVLKTNDANATSLKRDCARLREQRASHIQELEILRKESEDRNCKICMEEKADCAFTACGHVASCVTCTERMQVRTGDHHRRCPMCRHSGPHKKAYIG